MRSRQSKFRAHLVLAALALFLTACTSTYQRLGSWPQDIPSRDYFVGVYAADIENQNYQSRDDYLSWVLTFYQGNSMSDGWLAMSEEVLAEVSPEDRVAVGMQLHALGQRIGGEWAKDNRVRLIDTRCASIWREALVEAVFQDEVENFLAEVNQDVDALFAGNLVKAQIAFERYFEEEEIEFI